MRSSNSRPMGLFGWVKTNNARSVSYFLAFAFASQLLAATILFVPLALLDEAHSPLYGPLGYVTRYMPMILAGTLVLFAVQLYWYTNSVQKAAGFCFVDASDEPQLCAMIEELLTLTGLPAPYVAVIETPALNAFACGITRSKSVLVVTRGLLNELKPAELRAVLAHEITHIRNGDMRLMAAASICVSNLRRMHKWNPLHFRNAIHALICIGFPVFFPLMLVGGLIAQIAIRAAFGSRLIISGAREYVADAEAARLTKNPAALASALFKVQGRHRISASSRENDAMMIAGDSDGPTATHPDIEERVDALARTTGSMVFNAPDAHQKSKADRFARKAAGADEQQDRWAAFKKVGAVTGENIFGLTRIARWTFLGALAISIAWQGADAFRPSAVLDKMDVRQFGTYLGTDSLHCPFAADTEQCFEDTQPDFSQFSNQQGTYLGFMTERGDAARAKKKEDLEAFTSKHNIRMQPFRGDSGLLEDFEWMIGDNGKYLNPKGNSPSYMTVLPRPVKLAETKQVGCFHEPLAEGKNIVAEIAMDEPFSGKENFSGYLKDVGMAARMALGGGDEEILQYAATRRSITRVAFDFYGPEGLEAIQMAYASDAHNQVLERLKERLKDPKFAADKSNLDRIELMNLAKRPERYVPCFALSHTHAEKLETKAPIFGDFQPEP